MPTSYGALCSDFYVNLKLGVKMDLPSGRETVMEFLDRVRREAPRMSRFRRYEGELALETPSGDEPKQQWLALRRTSIRGGIVNPDSFEDAYHMHRLVLSLAPFYLSVSPLDVDVLEVVFGFDLEAKGNHNQIVHDALLAGTPMAELVRCDETTPIDLQPFFGVALSKRGDLQAAIEIKTRTSVREIRTGRYREDPISVFLSVRKFGAMEQVEDLPARFEELAEIAEQLAETRVAPHLLTPLREAIASSQF